MRTLLILLLWLAGPAAAQDLTAFARVNAEGSVIEDGWFGRSDVTLSLSQGVPYRVFTLDDPARLVIDFREADFSGIVPADILPVPGHVSAVRFGAFRPGWSRLVADLAQPMLPATIGMRIDPSSGAATIAIALERAEQDAFAAAAGAPPGAGWDVAAAAPPPPPMDDGVFTVVLDPGHGGVDPGAVRDGVSEKALMLQIAAALAESLRRTGEVRVVLTRTEDVFVSLPGRVALAHEVRADLFVSLHADALSQGGARGATVYTLSEQASDAASAQLAVQHDRADIIAGLDLAGTDDQVAGVLMDLARQETEPRARAASAAVIAAMDAAGGPMNSRPARQAGFSVLKSADIPSILIEVGFLSSPRDLANLRDPVWRAVMVEAIAQGILDWRAADLAQQPLVRQ
ncbi:MAG: N-acetylmuramoyl-L-alanine amidase [Pseudomonadota bacterium]